MKKLTLFVIMLLCISTIFAQTALKDVIPTCTVNSNFTKSKVDCDDYNFYATSTSSGTIKGYFWTFGDGQTSTSQNPSHHYNSNGTYMVTLTTVSTNGSYCCSDTECMQVVVNCASTDCGTITDFSEYAPNGEDCMVQLRVWPHQIILDPGWTIQSYSWNCLLVNTGHQVNGVGNPVFVDLTDNGNGPWTITLTVTAQDANGNICVLTKVKQRLSGCWGESPAKFDFNVFPNPSKEVINVNLEGEKSATANATVHLIDSFGIKRKSESINSDLTAIDISDINNGLYFIQLEIDGEVIVTKKVVVQK